MAHPVGLEANNKKHHCQNVARQPVLLSMNSMVTTVSLLVVIAVSYVATFGVSEPFA